MATLDSLAGDQRAVLQLVLARRRGYEEIARMLSIGPDVVRGRALGALEALAPPDALDADERRLIGDYLLSQLPEAGSADARALLSDSPAGREWALALTPVLEPLAVDPLPRIPPASTPAPAPRPSPSAEPAPDPEPDWLPREPAAELEPAGAAEPAPDRPPSSRRGGMVVIALAVVVIVAAVVVLLVTRGHHGSHGGLAADTRSSTTSTTSTTTSSTSTSAVKALAQINLHPAVAGSKAVAVVVVVREGTTLGIEMFGEHIPPNQNHNSYEVWLYSSPTHFEKLGFVSPAVGKNGRFSVVNGLPSNVRGYQQLIVTTETAQKPTHPGPVLLRGTIPHLP